jgi:hypothetical protein
MPELNRALWQRLSPLLDRALDLETTARRDLLAAVRLEDPGLAAALEGLLAEHQQVLASGFLETPPRSVRLQADRDGPALREPHPPASSG